MKIARQAMKIYRACFLQCDAGSAAVEYSIVLGLIAVGLISAISSLNQTMSNFYQLIAIELARIAAL
jgi:Flp pilus assembly pilin Flp